MARLRYLLKVDITESKDKNKEPEFKMTLSGNIEEQTAAIANIHHMKIKQIAQLQNKSFEAALADYFETLKAIVLVMNKHEEQHRGEI
ncbi:hypothetical protein [Listeria aquatica]|uniref:hypothetical protein n=1 Tax=Listeria aquatica TaxID=1494960 RepID=UPI0031F541D5